MDSMRAFAGPIEKAVVEPAAVAALIEFGADVRHYDVIEEVPSDTPTASDARRRSSAKRGKRTLMSERPVNRHRTRTVRNFLLSD